MILTIENEDGLLLKNFCIYLIKNIKEELLQNMNNMKIKEREKIINKAFGFEDKKILDPVVVVRQAIYNIIWKKKPSGDYIITVNPDIYIYKTKVKLINALKVIEYGTLGATPLHLFRDILKDYEENIQTWYELYEKEEDL